MHTVVSNSFATLWTVAHQAPLSMEVSRQEYWSGLPFPSPRDLPNPGIEPKSPELAGRFFPAELPEMQVRSLGPEDPLEEEMATHSSLLAWKLPWTEEPGGLQSMRLLESDTTERQCTHRRECSD